MKTLTRRQALRALTLSLGTGTLLTGCGGNWNFGLGPVQGGGGGSSNTAPGQTRSTGRVTLPSGSPLRLDQLTLTSGWSAARLSSDGSFTLDQLSGAPALLVLTDSTNRLLLMGFSGSTSTGLVGEVSPLQTSVALLFLALGAFTLPLDQHERVRTLLKNDSQVQALATQLERALAANPYALAENEPTLINAIAALRDTLHPTTSRALATKKPTRHRAEPLDATLIQTSPENELHGFLAGANGDSSLGGGLGLTIINSRRRNAILSIYESAYYVEGSTDPIKAPNPAYHRLVSQQILWGTSGLAGVVGSLVDYANGTVAYGPVTSGPYNLNLFPSNAIKTEYRVELVANGNTGDSSGLLREHVTLPGETTPLGKHIQICFITFVKDFLVPAIATFAGLQNSLKLDLRSLTQDDLASTALLKAFDDLAVIFSGVIDFGVAISADSVRSMLVAVLKAIGNNGTLRQKFIEWFVRIFAKDEFAHALAGFGGVLASIVNVVVILVDKILGIADLGAVLADWTRSDSYLLFTSKVIAAKLRLSPNEATITAGDTVNLRANTIVDAPVISYHWSVANGSGTLLNPVSGTSGATLDSASPDIRYQSKTSRTKETVTITVEAFIGGLNDPNRKSIGKATSTLTVNPTSVTLAPATSTLFPGDSLSLSASLSGTVQGTVRYVWTLGGGVSAVSLSDSSGHGGTSFESDQSTVRLTTSAASQGTATVGVEAVVIGPTGERTLLGTASATVTINDDIPFGYVRVAFDGKTRLLPQNSSQRLGAVSGLALGIQYQKISTDFPRLDGLKLILQFPTKTVTVGSTSTVVSDYDLTLELATAGESIYLAPSATSNLIVTEVGQGYFGYTLNVNLKGLRGVPLSGPAVIKGWVTYA